MPGCLQHFWPALAVSWVVAALFGVLLGAPTLRLRGDYLAIVTLGFGEIVPNFFRNADKVHRRRARAQPDRPAADLHALRPRDRLRTATDQDNWYWLMLAIGLFSLFMIRRLYDSRLGRTWQAIREDEIAASSMGVNLVKTKLWRSRSARRLPASPGRSFPPRSSLSIRPSSNFRCPSPCWRWSSSAASATSTASSPGHC